MRASEEVRERKKEREEGKVKGETATRDGADGRLRWAGMIDYQVTRHHTETWPYGKHEHPRKTHLPRSSQVYHRKPRHPDMLRAKLLPLIGWGVISQE